MPDDDWFKYLNYDYKSLIQYTAETTDLSEYEKLFHVVWWQNLRIGNWQLFKTLLNSRTQRDDHLIAEGTWGTLSAPAGKCNQSRPLSVVYDNKRAEAFQYIWASVKSLNKSIEEDFVVIGYNAPLFEVSW